jgi:hypothetical protein
MRDMVRCVVEGSRAAAMLWCLGVQGQLAHRSAAALQLGGVRWVGVLWRLMGSCVLMSRAGVQGGAGESRQDAQGLDQGHPRWVWGWFEPRQ